jgi:hypothetical protein
VASFEAAVVLTFLGKAAESAGGREGARQTVLVTEVVA